MDAIGRESGVNKERVYQYFGSKSGFFAAVLDHRLTGVLDGIPIEGSGAEAVGTWALMLFDRFGQHPDLARLLAWESLELPEPVAAAHRTDSCATQVTGLQVVLPGLARADAQQLLLSLVTLVTGWWTLVHVSVTIIAEHSDSDARRIAVRRQAEVLAAAAAA